MSEWERKRSQAHIIHYADFQRLWRFFCAVGGDFVAKNLRPLAKKLQMAIAIKRNRRISIDQKQFYSAKAQRTVTKYTLTEYNQDTKNYTTLFASWSLPDVIKYLAAILNEEA